MECPSCGDLNRNDAAFCGECGAALAVERRCPSCALSNPPTRKFCDGCGNRLTEEQPVVPAGPITPALPESFADDRYQVRRLLGEGGAKRVYLARDTKLDSDIAIALIKTEGLDAEGLTRVRREAKAMARLRDHQHVVTVHDIGDENGQPYIVQEFLQGGSLEDRLERAADHRLPLEEALRIAEQVCGALEHAHEHGVIHRDMKPGNVWLTQEGAAKLGDFGLAIAMDRSQLTQEGMILGTVAYMPPEFAVGGGHKASVQSDLYSLGCTLYEMVTGRPPFLGDDAVSIISQHINTAPVAPSWHNSELPRDLEAWIMRLLAKAPEERPETAAAVREALSTIASAATNAAEQPTLEKANPLDRLAGGVFVGRDPEMEELRAALGDGLSGHGQLLMIVGEPGIGKTRLADEFATYARLRGAQVLWGRCYEGEGAPAYWPWVQLIRSYVHERDPDTLISEMGPSAAAIAQVVSEVREVLPALPEPPSLEPDEARFRLFDGITSFLKNASIHQPLVIILDDLHWADKPSLLLLQFLARELVARLVIIGTYRDVELGRQHPLSQTLAELSREGLSRRIVLRGLAEANVARFIEMTAGKAPPETLVSAVQKEAEGNPFFVNEIVRYLVADGKFDHAEDVTSWSVTIPQSIREVVGRRLDHLSEECNAVLTVASVVGREFGMKAVERVSDLAGDQLLSLLEEAVAARIIIEIPDSVGQYAFSHSLVRETLYEELSTTRRVALHRRIAETLEELYGSKPEPHLAELAYHFFEGARAGGDVDKAIDYARRAGARATDQLAHEEAVAHYETALQALELKQAPDESTRCELLLARGGAHWAAAQPETSRATFIEAVDIARELGAAELLTSGVLGYGARVSWTAEPGGPDQELIRLLEEALAAVGEEDCALRVYLLARLAVELATTAVGQKPRSLDRGDSLSRQAVDMARRIGDVETLMLALDQRNWVLIGPDHVEERLASASELMRLDREAGDEKATGGGHMWYLVTSLELGDIAAVDDVLEEWSHRYIPWWVTMLRAMRALLDGRFDEGEELAQQALAFGQRARTANAFGAFSGQMFMLRWEQGRLSELEGLAKGPVLEDNPPIQAMLYAELGRDGEARSVLDRLAANNFTEFERDSLWLSHAAILAYVCSLLGDAHRAPQLYEALLPYAELNVTLPMGILSLGSAAFSLGMLAATMSRWEDAERHFKDALAMNERMGARTWLARTQHEYASMLLKRGGRGDGEQALALLTPALETAQELGMKGLLDKALELKLKLQGVPTTSVHTSIDAIAATMQVERPDLRQHAAPDGTVTILFTDIEGSTATNERLGYQRWMELLRAHSQSVREQVRAHGGFEVKTEGDGFMVAFAGARSALQCAIGIQRAFAQHNESADEPVSVRIGLHTGEPIREADDFFGRHVNLAARVASQARGGEIMISSLVRELTESAGDIEFGEGREVELKGFSENQRIFTVRW